MARVYPTIGDRDTPDSERKVLARLRERLPDSWVVFHGRSIVQSRGRPRSREREVDFVVLDPARGYLVLEVKGGEVSCRDGKWRSRARNGATHDIKNPGAQAQDGAHALHKYLRGSARFRPSGASRTISVREAACAGPITRPMTRPIAR